MWLWLWIGEVGEVGVGVNGSKVWVGEWVEEWVEVWVEEWVKV